MEEITEEIKPDAVADAALKPCELSCPKCGSVDISRRFHAQGSYIQSEDYGKRPSAFTQGTGYRWEVHTDHIIHHCRCCQYDWATKPLPKRKKRRAKA